jgi:hypothetical protein
VRDAKLWPGIHITTVRMGHFGKKGCIYALEKKVAQKLRHFSKFCVITYEGAESSDTFREKGEYTLRGVKVVKKVKIFPAVLQKTSYVASRGRKKMKIFPSVLQIFAYVASRRH